MPLSFKNPNNPSQEKRIHQKAGLNLTEHKVNTGFYIIHLKKWKLDTAESPVLVHPDHQVHLTRHCLSLYNVKVCFWTIPPNFHVQSTRGTFSRNFQCKKPLVGWSSFLFKFCCWKGEGWVKKITLCIFVNSYSFVNTASQSNERQYAAWLRWEESRLVQKQNQG